jgi:hypothetical protein
MTCVEAQCVEAAGLSCGAVLQCVGGCGDFTCYDACAATGDAGAQALLAVLLECLQSTCVAGWNLDCWMIAAQGPCKTQLDACMADS